MLSLLYILLSIVGLFVWQTMKRPRGAPPGPVGWPFVGTLFSMGKNPSAYFQKLARKYGNVIGVYLGPTFTVVINDFETGREAFLKKGETFSSRADSYVIDQTFHINGCDERAGIFMSAGKQWKVQRKFLLRTLREFGMGKISLEGKIQEEIEALVTVFKNKKGEPFNARLYLHNASGNIISSILFGKRFEYENPKFTNLMLRLTQDVSNPYLAFIDMYPLIRHLPGVRNRYKQFEDNERFIKHFVQDFVDEHLKSYNPNQIRDLVDTYIKKMKEAQETGDNSFNVNELAWSSVNLFFAGTDTTSNTLYWGLVFLLHHPNIKKRVQAEIDDVIGKARFPSITDKAKMPYTEATIAEVQRLGNIVPLGVPHATSQTVTLNGYRIPARTPVMLNLEAILLDPNVFSNPEEFRPERHLGKHEELLKQETLIPFSVGRRFCVGEALARMELFLFFVGLLQSFDILLPDGADLPSREPKRGLFVASAQDFQVRFIPQ